MIQLNLELKNDIINKLEEIISLKNDNSWVNLDTKIKIKLIHHYCNFINENKLSEKLSTNDIIKIPLKSIKPRKFIQYTCFNKQNNKKLFNEYLNIIRDYTFNFRNSFLKNNIYYTYNNMPKDVYNNIINLYNKHIYDFLIKNKNSISIDNLYNNLLGNNNEKLINSNNKPTILDILENKNRLELIFNNNINIILELVITSNKITNNIPVKYIVKLINKF